MAASLTHVFAQVQRWTSPRRADATDAELLERFVHRREEAAFAALVARHGGMVLRTCRRILGDAHAAEDALQATFLILARKAASLKQPQALPGWLHGVARRVALKARAKAIGRGHEKPLTESIGDSRHDPLAQLTARELLIVLDEEIARLPAKQRAAVLLCCVEGCTQEEAARRLGCTAGSLRGHLERGRRRLQARLIRRGIALSAALAAVAISRGEAASALLRRGVVHAVMRGAAGTSAAKLAERVLKGMLVSQCAAVSVVAMTVILLVAAAGLTFSPAPVEKPAAEEPPPAGRPRPHVDAMGDPLPTDAIARLGTVRFRQGAHIGFVRFTPDGKRLVSQAIDGVRIWDAANGKELKHFASEAGRIWGSSDLSPDGKRVAVAAHGPPEPIQIWDIESGRKIDKFGEGFYSLVRYSPDGKRLAVSSNARIELWDVAARKKLRDWKAHRVQVMSLAFSGDGQKLLTAGSEGKYYLWDATTGRQLREIALAGWQPNVIGMPLQAVFSPDGKRIARIEKNEKRPPEAKGEKWEARISLWDGENGKLLRHLSCPSREIVPGYASSFRALVFSRDGKRLYTGGPDHFLRIWDTATGEELRRLPVEPGPFDLALSPDEQKMAIVVFGVAIRIVDLSSGKVTSSTFGHLTGLNEVLLTSDGRTAVTAGQDGTLLVWDADTGRIRRRLKGLTDAIHSLWLAPDGRTVYAGAWDSSLRVWDLLTGEEKRRLQVDSPRTGIFKVFASSDSKSILTMNAAQQILLLDAATGQERQRFGGPEWLLGLALSPDGRSLVGWAGDRKVRIWDVATGQLSRAFSLPPEDRRGMPVPVGGPGPSLYSAAVSPDGRLLTTGSREIYGVKRAHFLLLKDLATERDVLRVDKLPSDVNVLAFSPDGRMVAYSGYTDPTIRVLETATGGERRRFIGHRGRVTTVAFSADGRRLISGCIDTTALVWDLGRLPIVGYAAVALEDNELEGLWSDLAGKDAARAYRAIGKLAAFPTSAVPFLQKRLRPVPPLDEKRIARLIGELDSDDFPTRQKATTELQKLGELPLPAYRRALASKPSIELRRRVQELMEKAESVWWDLSPERLRALRAVEALELADTAEARRLLDALAAGADGARLTEQAVAARQRLGKNASAKHR